MIITRHNDNQRTGANLAETILKPANVKAGPFGKLVTLPVEGAVYAQPLVAPGVAVQGRTVNLLVVATMHNRVYGFDADAKPSGEGMAGPLWVTGLEPSVPLPDSAIGPSGYKDMEWEVGILSTPVIDTAAGHLWVVATSRAEGGPIVHKLYKLGLSDGARLATSPPIEGKVKDAVFVSHLNNQRASLLHSQGRIYVAFASYGDRKPYHGWVFAFDAVSLARIASFCVTPKPGGEQMGGIWQAGEGLCADAAGNIYLLTGNGEFDPENRDSDSRSFGDCALKLDKDLKLRDYFSPFNNKELDERDADLGSGGVLAIPNEKLIIGGGKESILYLMDMDNLGKFHPEGDQVLQRFYVGTPDRDSHHIHGTPVFWEGPADRRIFVWTENDQMRAFRFGSDKRFNPAPVAMTRVFDPSDVPGGSPGMPGGFLTVSAHGKADGIVWANHPWNADLNQQIGDGVLRAFDAVSLDQLYSSKAERARDDFGNFAKFCPPTVSGGRVFVATMGGLERRTEFAETCLATPSLVSEGAKGLLLGWTDGESRLNFRRSADGLIWAHPYVMAGEKTRFPPAMARDPAADATLLAWTDNLVDDRISLVGLKDHGAARALPEKKNTLWERSHMGPSLAFLGGKYFLAWVGTDFRINIDATENGIGWYGKQTLDERTDSEVSLVAFGTKLLLLWVGTDKDKTLNLATIDPATRKLVAKRTLDHWSRYRPGVALGGGGGRLVWAGRDDRNLIEMLLELDESADLSKAKLSYRRTFREKSAHGVALAFHKGRYWAAWPDDAKGAAVRVGELSRGSVAVYGLSGTP